MTRTCMRDEPLMYGIGQPHDDDEDVLVRLILLTVGGEVMPDLGARHWIFSLEKQILQTSDYSLPPHKLQDDLI
jgi:hypothetical protein